MSNFSDAPLERALLAGIIKGGFDSYVDISDILDISTFTVDSNQAIYRIIKNVYESDNEAHLDFPLILSKAKDLGIAEFFQQNGEKEYLERIFSFPTDPNNVFKFAAKLRKTQVAKLHYEEHIKAAKRLENLTGAETYEEILTISNGDIESLVDKLDGDNNTPMILSEGVDEWLANIEKNPDTLPGISTGFKRLDLIIGGGLHIPSVNVVVGRPGSGKTQWGGNFAINISSRDQDVLILDTEMDDTQLKNRILAYLSRETCDDIKFGRVFKNSFKKKRVAAAAEKFKNLPISWMSVKGKPIQQTIQIIKRWNARRPNKDKPPVVIYDYIKVMSEGEISNNKSESMILGIIATELHNCMAKIGGACVTFAQMNRLGLKGQDTDVVFGSDKILQYVDTLMMYKAKGEADIDGEDEAVDLESGSHKLYFAKVRNGGGVDPNDYLNIIFEKEYATLKEGKLFSEIKKEKRERKRREAENQDDDDVSFDPN